MADKDLYCNYIAEAKMEEDRFLVPEGYEKDMFNDSGFVIRAKAESGEDIHLWMFMYRQQGPEIVINNVNLASSTHY